MNFHPWENGVSGLYVQVDRRRFYLPHIKASVHATILDTTARTILTQTFANPDASKTLREVKYLFPLYEGVSVVSFRCTIGDKVLVGKVYERQEARQVYQDAVDKGDTAGLLEQLPSASDVFIANVGNIPGGSQVRVEIEYLGELKHDAQVDGVRYTVPTKVAPRYGDYPGELVKAVQLPDDGFEIVVDVQLPPSSAIKSIQSPSHPISVSIGTTSTAPEAEPQLQKASATLSLKSVQMDKDCVFLITATNMDKPSALIEKHPHHSTRAVMATLVPKFALPSEYPEIVFVCDRSGSMSSKVSELKTALNILVKSLPIGVKFNLCSFGSRYSFLWPRSKDYTKETVGEAIDHINKFSANYGGTEMLEPIRETMSRRFKDCNLEVILLTDGDIWGHEELFNFVQTNVHESKGAVRVFTLGIGAGASHALVEGLARKGNGFCQVVGDNEKMNAKMVRILKGAVSPHITDYSLEIQYDAEEAMEAEGNDDFEMIDNVDDSLVIPCKKASKNEVKENSYDAKPTKPISLYDPDADVDSKIKDNDTPEYLVVPPVDPPKILQAPVEVPALFPFNRTTIYLLLSGSAAERPIRSIRLRGTSTVGPLELEIHVTQLPEPGETIHQLAARKAVRELEDGAGWLHHARDEDGKLLKDQFDRKFETMVKREAVRLGVDYHVGGKWCSFVAVDKDSAESSSPKETYEIILPQPGMLSRRSPGGPPIMRGGGLGMVGGPAVQMMSVTMAAAPPPPTFCPAPAPGAPMMGSAKMAAGEPRCANVRRKVTSFGAREVEPLEPLEVIVSQQTFEGYWTLSSELATAMGLDRDAILQVTKGATGGNESAAATAAVLAFFEAKLPDEKDVWELIADKARAWLVQMLGDEKAEKAEKSAHNLF